MKRYRWKTLFELAKAWIILRLKLSKNKWRLLGRKAWVNICYLLNQKILGGGGIMAQEEDYIMPILETQPK